MFFWGGFHFLGNGDWGIAASIKPYCSQIRFSIFFRCHLQRIQCWLYWLYADLISLPLVFLLVKPRTGRALKRPQNPLASLALACAAAKAGFVSCMYRYPLSSSFVELGSSDESHEIIQQSWSSSSTLFVFLRSLLRSSGLL